MSHGLALIALIIFSFVQAKKPRTSETGSGRVAFFRELLSKD
jgi:hypothetical protein